MQIQQQAGITYMNNGKNAKKAFDFLPIAERQPKPRSSGLTMILDRGIGYYAACDMMQSSEYIDIIKLGWATPRLMKDTDLLRKVELYKEHDILVGNGGTLLEIAFKQKRIDDFFRCCSSISLDLIEVSNGIFDVSVAQKAEIICRAREKGFNVISEVGKKDPLQDCRLSMQDRIEEAQSDIGSGARYVIIEARESGKNLGVYDDRGGLKQEMAVELADSIGTDKIMFEAPEKNQQAGLIMIFGPDVNLGNIGTDDVIPLETLRRGIRGDTCGKV